MAESKQGMSEADRFEALLSRQRPDRVPVWPIPVGYSVINSGYAMADFYKNPKVSIDAQVWANEQYGWLPIVSVPGANMCWPASEFGGEFKWPEGEFSQAPCPTPGEEQFIHLPSVPVARAMSSGPGPGLGPCPGTQRTRTWALGPRARGQTPYGFPVIPKGPGPGPWPLGP